MVSGSSDRLRKINKYDRPLFQPNNPKIPDSSSSPKKVG